ncbi:MAG: DUF2452 domain-containing protein [Gammaproteobacteria bacterium]|nr:DUF2452 domain-containing protein [Gammaproteobacteria bacterium]
MSKNKPPEKHQGADHSAPYPVSRLAPTMELVDLAQQISTAAQAIANQTSGKLRLIADQIKALQAEAHRILDEAKQHQTLHRATCHFPRKAGHTYHLYEKADGTRYFSMLSPTEWGGRPPHRFVGSYRLESDMSWTPADQLDKQNDSAEMVRQLLDDKGLLP